jgi:hypothetical protein
MADQNCSHQGCSCKVEQGRGVSKLEHVLQRPLRQYCIVCLGKMAVWPPRLSVIDQEHGGRAAMLLLEIGKQSTENLALKLAQPKKEKW